jgi:hypothetical protein
MAVLSSILHPATEVAIRPAALATGQSTAEIALGPNRIFAINADQDITIKFGNAGMTAAAGTEYRIPANQQTTFDTGANVNSIRLWNLAATNANIYIILLSRN